MRVHVASRDDGLVRVRPLIDSAPRKRADDDSARSAFGSAAGPDIRFDPLVEFKVPQLPFFVHYLF